MIKTLNLFQLFLLILYLYITRNIVCKTLYLKNYKKNKWQIILMKISLKIRNINVVLGFDISKKIDPTKSTKSRECMISHYWFKFHYSICNGCHDLSMLCLNVSDIAIILVKSVCYRCIIYNLSKSEAINLLENSVLEDRGYI